MVLSTYSETKKYLSKIDDNALIRLVYVSRMTHKTKDEVWLNQVHSDTYNHHCSHRIAGFRCHGKDTHFECLEGKKNTLLRFVDQIFADKRYKKIKVILTKPINKISFRGWCLHYTALENTATGLPVGLRQYLPFKPLGWPLWYIDYFATSMQAYEGVEGKYSFIANAAHFTNPINPTMRLEENEQTTVMTLLSEQPQWINGGLLLLSLLLIMLQF